MDPPVFSICFLPPSGRFSTDSFILACTHGLSSGVSAAQKFDLYFMNALPFLSPLIVEKYLVQLTMD